MNYFTPASKAFPCFHNSTLASFDTRMEIRLSSDQNGQLGVCLPFGYEKVTPNPSNWDGHRSGSSNTSQSLPKVCACLVIYIEVVQIEERMLFKLTFWRRRLLYNKISSEECARQRLNCSWWEEGDAALVTHSQTPTHPSREDGLKWVKGWKMEEGGNGCLAKIFTA